MEKEILNNLFALQDKKYKKFHSGLCPNISDDFIIGVRVPLLRSLAKKLAKENTPIDSIGTTYYEEIMLRGMLIGLTRYNDFCDFKAAVADFVPLINNWAICDTFCTGLKQIKSFRHETLEFIVPYLSSEFEFYVRFGVVMLLAHYINDEYINTTLSLLRTVKHEGYYAKMAVAWALSVALVHNYSLTLEFIKNNNFDKFTHNKALQKARESFRITKEQKDELQKLKK